MVGIFDRGRDNIRNGFRTYYFIIYIYIGIWDCSVGSNLCGLEDYIEQTTHDIASDKLMTFARMFPDSLYP